MKYVIVIGDGMADNPLPRLAGQTPLQRAATPVMDELARHSTLGTVRTVPPGLPAGSDTAILSIFGYDPARYHTGRAPLEAAGSGVALQAGDVCYRCNLVSLGGAGGYINRSMASHSGGSVDGETALLLMDALLHDRRLAAMLRQQRLVLRPAPSFRHIAVQAGADISGLRTTPPHDHLGEGIAALLPTGGPAAEGLRRLMELAHAILEEHPANQKRRQAGKLPANGLWFWAEGTAMALPAFGRRFGGKTGVIVSAVPLARGIGVLAGMAAPEVAGATGELDTDYEGKTDAALAALAQGADLAVIHIEAPDECTHNGDLAGKLQAIEWLDSRCLARLRAGLEQSREPYRLLLLSDHKTLMENGRHDGDPVPFLLFDSRSGAAGGAQGFSEAACADGLFIEAGHTLMERLLAE